MSRRFLRMREDHAQILIETGKALHLVMSAIALDATVEDMNGKVIDDLGEYDIACIHQPFLSTQGRDND